MSKINLERLERQISKGKFHFVLLWGVIGWGIPVALVMKLIQYFFGNRSFFDGLISWLVVFSIAGIFYGIWLWSYQNKKYEKAKSANG